MRAAVLHTPGSPPSHREHPAPEPAPGRTLVRVTAATPNGKRSVAGTLFGNSAPRLVDIFGVAVEAELEGPMLYIVNNDAPGFIGKLGTTLGEAGLNIAT